MSQKKARCAAPTMRLTAEEVQKRDLAIERLNNYFMDEALEEKEDLDTPSSTRIPLNIKGQPLLTKYAYVDEPACIGC